MADDFTPTTEQVRAVYVIDGSRLTQEQRGVGFDHWLALHDAAVRRVAPDRETLAKTLFDAEWDGAGRSWDRIDSSEHLRFLRLADAVLASGVLGVPAEHATPTMERIDEAAIQLMMADSGWPREMWTNGQLGSEQHEFWRSQVRRVLVVVGGVPADQRTADRETIARTLLFELREYEAEDNPTSLATFAERQADAVLAVLVPAEGGER